MPHNIKQYIISLARGSQETVFVCVYVCVCVRVVTGRLVVAHRPSPRHSVDSHRQSTDHSPQGTECGECE
jgi:hypothetical protein